MMPASRLAPWPSQIFAGSFILILLCASHAVAAPDKCTASKLKALGKAQKSAISCYTKSQLDPAFDDAACDAKFLGKLEKKLTKIGNACAGQYDDCAERVLTCAPAVAAAGPDGASKCEVLKQKAAGKYAAALLKCLTGDEVTACSDAAAAKFQTATAKADALGACDGTATAIDAAVAAHCVDKIAPPGDPIPLCTGCAEASDCTEANYCDDATCTPDVCTPGERECDGSDDLLECAQDGSAMEPFHDCSDLHGCLETDDLMPYCGCFSDADCHSSTQCIHGKCLGDYEFCEAPRDLAVMLPVSELQWGGVNQSNTNATGSPFPASGQVGTMPMVANLNDDNGDGYIDDLDYPEIVFMSYCGTDITVNGIVRAIHGGGPNKGEDYFATCGSTVWHEGDDIDMPCACTTATANSTATLAVGDIDGDGIPEIVVPNENSGLTVLDNTGEPIAETGPNQWVSYPGPAPVIANLDNDGLAEIVVGRHAFTMSKDLQMLFVNRFSGTLMNGINNLGPVPCVADIAGDSRPEIVAGSTVYAFPEPPPGVTTIEECPGGAMDDFCLGRLTVVWDAQAVNGSVVVPNAQRDGFCAIADVLGTDETIAPGPDNPLDGTAEVVLVGEGYLQIYNGQTGLSRRFINMGLGSDGGTPALADTDNDGFPEIGVGFGARYALVDLQSASPSCPAWPNAFVDSGSGLQGNAPRTPGAACAVDGDCAGGAVCRSGNCVCLHNGWQRVIEDDSSRATAAAAFDMNGDGASEILYNDECYLRMYDGTTGEVLLKHRSPSRTRIESPVVADADRDGRAEIVWSSNTDASLCSEGSNYPNGVFMFGDSSETWVPTRSIWNQHSYHVTNVADDAGIPVIEANSWIDQGEQPFNTYRSNTNTCPVP